MKSMSASSLGGLQCAKSIIDNGNAITQAMHCMNASIFLNAPTIQPTDDHVKLFREAGDAFLKVCAEIEVYVAQGGTGGTGNTTTATTAAASPSAKAPATPKRRDTSFIDGREWDR